MTQHREWPEANNIVDWSVQAKGYVLLTAIAVLFDGFDNQVLGFALPAMIRDLGLDKTHFAPVVAIGVVGMMIGAGVGGRLGDRWGRKSALIASIVLFAMATGAVAGIGGIPALSILRFLAGFGIGSVFPNAAALAAEFSPPQSRSLAVSATIVCVPLGGMVGGLVAAEILPVYGWRVLFGLGGIAPLVVAVALWLLIPESPWHLARRPGSEAKAREVAAKLGFAWTDEARAARHPGDGQLLSILGPALRRDTLALWGSFFFSIFAVYTVFNWAPTLITGLGANIAAASRATAAYNFGGVIGALGCAWLIGRFGSRTPMVVMAFLGAASAGVLILIAHPMPDTTQLTLWMGAHGLFVNAVQTSLYVLAAHIYPTSMRATGAGVALAIGRLGSIVGSYAGAAILAGGQSRYFIILAVAMIACAFCILAVRNHVGATAARRSA